MTLALLVIAIAFCSGVIVSNPNSLIDGGLLVLVDSKILINGPFCILQSSEGLMVTGIVFLAGSVVIVFSKDESIKTAFVFCFFGLIFTIFGAIGLVSA